MKIHTKLISSFGSILVLTLAVFGMINYHTFAENIHQTSDRLLILQSNNIIYQFSKVIDKKINAIEHQLSKYVQSSSYSLGSATALKLLLADLAHQNPPFNSIALHSPGDKDISVELQSWLDEIGDQTAEPIFRQHSDDLFLLWPTQTPTGQALLVITIDQDQLTATLRSYLSIGGAALLLSNGNTPMIAPVQQDPLKPLSPANLAALAVATARDHVTSNGAVYTYRSPDTLFGANVSLAVPLEFYQKNLISLKNRTIAAMLVVGWVSIWVLLVIAYKISSPIRQLSKITKDIIAFNYTYQ